MNSSDINHEKATAIHRYRKRQRLVNLFRFIELVIFMIAVSRFSLPLTYKFPGEYYRGIFLVFFSPKFVFVIGNVIVLVLFFKAGGHYSSPKLSPSDNKIPDEIPKRKTREVVQVKMNRSHSEIFKRDKLVESGRKLKRSVTETRRKFVDREEEMSGEEFRQTVEAFIARQQKILREEGCRGFSVYEKKDYFTPYETSV